MDDRDSRRFGLKFTKSVDRFFNSIDFKGPEKILNSRFPEKALERAGFQRA
ncbi:MAG: hypothetical protein VZR10_10545 [Methanobrevibacter sp.]|jgi:hypothetical protein|nr:hypothetical protein [Methanobrevibacter sp.]